MQRKLRKEWLSQINWNDNEYDNTTNCAYIIELYKGENRRWLKIGYSGHMEDRMVDHLKNKKYDIDRIEVISIFQFSNEDSALSMENTLRRYFKAKNDGLDFLPRDRFGLVECSRDDLIVLETKAKMIEVL